MIYLIGSIILTSWLTLSFKVIERLGLNTFQCIVFNYIFCVITGCFVNGEIPDYVGNVQQPWFKWACLMGTVFISLFNIIGFTAQKIGVAVSSVANKLSLVIPFVFSIYLYNESATVLKVIGIISALSAVILTCWKQKDAGEKVRSNWLFIMPVILFIGSGLLDTMIKYVEHNFLNPSNNDAYLITAFSMAAFLGIIGVITQLIRGKKFEWRAIVAGAAIGIPNYFSIWCLLQVLKLYSTNSSAIIPINNMGIVLFSAVMAWVMFRERLSAINWIGIALAMGSIALIAFG
ncbi:MAG TPA: hypothetical protein VJT83_02305 [Chitinophagaceae bacterium]|nr:hypothetical protein [Chitinophagaceae bacterium]